MDQAAAIIFYLEGLTEDPFDEYIIKNHLSSEFITMLSSKCWHQTLENKQDTLLDTLRHVSSYWKNKTLMNAIAEIHQFSQLIVINPRPLEFYEDLTELLIQYATENDQQAKWWAHKIIIACCGKTHLYSDMGFKNRKMISALFRQHFPLLANKNIGNKMRWKKFIYRQFCLAEQLPLCPTASCSECPSKQECYTEN
ncbi:nitrogen fixation protein NifQ [Shewanella sp. VB17]|uniref:nitrogen fixation protein NifQ n=1 Tax=Shewanella sp. VB17 TaxID=2739432 RepID=UPI001566BA1B|nr:nitrogen fixation protein NifQ [Shewanella sp. VB17]NRD75283.1 nitrogen fixation protein NifQ [Shewanella sp. VB17]